MNTNEVMRKAREDFAKLRQTSIDAVTALSKTPEGWVVSVEVLERKAIPDTLDVLGLYEIHLDDEGNLLDFDRKRLRKRGETKAE